MSYIRSKKEELTGFQEGAPYCPEIDLQCDFVMVYGTDEGMPERVRQFKEKGYVVHLMTGSAWGQYQDYLNGEWDGRSHWDESQAERNGEPILHGHDTPYMVPAVSFSDYLTEKLKTAVDAGVEAVHLEEPEFWDNGGYSAAFQREYQLYYHEPWQPPHESLDARYKASRLKAWLYSRTLSRISASLKEYAMVKYGRELRFYVPTHSLVNYTQWKILSPEAALTDIPSIDGYIAQIWTGTSRCANVLEGVVRERTFETAYLEYGIMQELVRGTGRKMWFLHDPIEDNPSYTWEDYRRNYLKTAIASLLHPAIHTYEICPWPTRVFKGRYPRVPKLTSGMAPGAELPETKAIPPSYATLLCSMVQLFGDMDQADFAFEGMNSGVGVFMADSGLYQRSYPDGVVDGPAVSGSLDESLQRLTARMHDGEDCSAESRALMEKAAADPNLTYAFIESGVFPNFFGMTMPLLKYGLPVRPVQLDNVRRFPGYLDDYTALILSYEFIKPESPDVNNALAAWVRGGGTLVYIGDGSDPYHKIKGWWNTGKADYLNPAEHLFEMLGLGRAPGDGVYPVGAGRTAVWNQAPALLCTSAAIAEKYRSFIREVLAGGGQDWEYCNRLTLRRGPYLISAVMDESVNEEPAVFRGLFADMLENDYAIRTEKTVRPDENAILFDFSKIEGEACRIVGCSARVNSLDCNEKGFRMEIKGAGSIHAWLRIRLPKPVRAVNAVDEDGNAVSMGFAWDDRTRTVLLDYDSQAKAVTVTGSF